MDTDVSDVLMLFVLFFLTVGSALLLWGISQPKPTQPKGIKMNPEQKDQLIALVQGMIDQAVAAAVQPAPVPAPDPSLVFNQADLDAAKAEGILEGKAQGILEEKAKVAEALKPVEAEVAPSA